MLLDNKNLNDDNIKDVFQFLENYTEKGEIDAVSGYFSISGLAALFNKLNDVQKFQLILGEITEDKLIASKAINLLAEDLSINKALQIKGDAKSAIDFIKQEKVILKTVEPNFCHAKLYVYKDNDKRKNYYILGSSNLTMAGLGLKSSSNIELNTAKFSDDGDFKDIQKWFNNLWQNSARDFTMTEDGKVNFKEFLIKTIENFYKKYTPLELYYKVLYELFKDELPELELGSLFQKEIGHLKNTLIFNTLYPFQQKGVLSLIRSLDSFNGAILADAVGLGKTWQALAVMKHYELKGYEVVLLCPKKLEHNWSKYKKGRRSKFEADRFDFTVRYHSDLQDNRLENKQDGLKIKTYFQKNPKILFVIDESHNLRNDKSNRYKFLVKELLKQNNDVKTLLLSATPINNSVTDIRNQFKLLVKGDDNGFLNVPEFEVKSLESLFRVAQKEFREWQGLPASDKKIASLIDKLLSTKLFDLTDRLIVARTRKIVASLTDDLSFPEVEKPDNIYLELGKIGKLSSFASVLDAIRVHMTAYRPSEFTDTKADNVLEDNIQREKFLAKMMYILLVKRLESSWFSFDTTINNILNHHINALAKVNQFLEAKKDDNIDTPITESEQGVEFVEDLEEVAKTIEEQLLADDDDTNDEFNPLELTLGKKRPIKLSEIVHIDTFKEYLEKDITQLKYLKDNLKQFKSSFDKEKGNNDSIDVKLKKLMSIIKEKQTKPNKKLLIFTAYKDTANYLFDELKKRGFARLGLITGTKYDTDVNIDYSQDSFEPLLEAFAPYTKLYMERDWSSYTDKQKFEDYDDFVARVSPDNEDVRRLIANPIDILIATDCISEGQNLQDCDCVINYDIHWNPVRLIQRLGRIDRLGSPNDAIKGINFWPGQSYDSYLNLKDRVEDRIALFSLVGSEYDPQMTPELHEKVKDNPLISRQVNNALSLLQNTWKDIDGGDETFGFDKLSLEEFRQELFDYINANRDTFEKIPNGVFTGFKARQDLFQANQNSGLIALLRYKPQNQTKALEKPEYHLVYANQNGTTEIYNQHQILTVLRKHKNEKRYVPNEIDENKQEALEKIASLLQDWMNLKAGKQAVADIQNLFAYGIDNSNKTKNKEELLLEEKYQNHNFELITWFVVS